MPGNAVKIGPFAGGLNTYSEPSAVGDNEVVDLVNFNIDLDGSIFTRPPIRIKETTGTIPGAGAMKLLGFFINTDNEKYLIASTSAGTYARRESTNVWTTITATFGATAFVQYQNKAYVIAPPDDVDPGGSWTPAGGFVAIAAMPKGASAVIYKERLFVAGGRLDATNANRVFFSNAGDFATWVTSTNFFDVRAGDGQHIVRISVFQDTIVCFKEDSTYAFSYDSSPARGAVRAINTTIGCSNINSVVEYENSLYVHHESSVYQLSNWNFTLINLKVPFEYKVVFVGQPSEPSLSILGDLLIVHHYDMIYVFGLRTGTWTRWEVALAQNFTYFIKVPLDDASQPQSNYASGRATAGANRVLYWWKNEWDLTGPEEITAKVVTKSYDFNVPYSFKRLFWWGVDLLSERDMQYVVHPITYTRVVTHAMMSAFTHAQITGTHATPLDISIDVTDSKTISNIAQNRMFLKLLKSLRFRQINFTISGTTDGASNTGPMRIYSVTAFVDNKQVVSKDVN